MREVFEKLKKLCCFIVFVSSALLHRCVLLHRMRTCSHCLRGTFLKTWIILMKKGEKKKSASHVLLLLLVDSDRQQHNQVKK